MSRRDVVAIEDLQPAIRRVVEDYNTFVAHGPAPGTHDDAKAFAAHHAAAKAALAHLEHLLKLARATGAGEEESGLAQAAALLRQARGALAEEPPTEEECDADDGPSG
ncbi:hypothetical protein E0493_10135 [Roseomonas sp. M0104]|uniref:Uncharacterized protein n=1 Tax=Teichococcus coralli TaxID=2545983 RepID=A0A845BAA3_9PROT|nr:hypothetical protein [Pseudoroseomonas coralli]MXP63705.1 hypothetical protein [Pseudoroseomonas coralli]